MKDMNKLIFFAQEASFFSAMVRPMLRYKKISYIEPLYIKGIFSDVFRKTGSVQMPQIETTQGVIIQDTTLICDYLEDNYPEKSMLPTSPIQLTVSRIIQEFANDFMILPAMHYRWNFKLTNWKICYYEFAQMAIPRYLFFLKPIVAANITPKIEMAYRKMGGLDKDFLPEIEKWYLNFLEKLNVHFSHHKYLLGNKPSIADCALMGPLYAHLGRDAYPKKIMLRVAPKVYQWVRRMNEPDHSDTDYMINDTIPETLLPILELIFKHQGEKTAGIIKKTNEHLESLTDVNQLLRRFSGKAEFRLGQYTGMRPTETHIAWLRQKMLTEYDALGESEKKLVNNFLEKYNWMQLFDLRLKKGIKRIRNKYYHIDADNDFVEKRDMNINQGAFSAGKNSSREVRTNKKVN